MTRRRILVTLTAAAAALAISAAPASALTETASSGNVTATMTYDKGGLFFKNVRISIARNGTTVLDQAAPSYPGCPDAGCPPNPGYAGKAPAVHVLQLDSTPEPEVVFDFFTGGIHCCWYSQIYEFKGGAYSGPPLQDWGNVSYTFFDPEKDGRSEFKSGDNRFAYAFGSYAATRFPPQIWRFANNGSMTDVTRSYPAIIRTDIKRLKRQFRKFEELGIKPLLAAFTADQCMLGSCGKGFALVNLAAKKGFLEQAGKFRRHLRRFLVRAGYL